MSKDLREQLNVLKDVEGHINPSKEWVSRTRASLLSTIAEQSGQAAEARSASPLSQKANQLQALMPLQFFARMRPVMVSVFVFALATSGWIASASASQSLPGDTLWRVKLATEKTQIVLADITGNAQKNVELQLKFAARRAAEIKTVSTEVTFTPEEKADRTEEGLKKLQENISSVDEVVQQAAQAEGAEEKKELSKQAKEVNDATTQISETLEEVADTVEATGSDDTSLTKEVVAVKQAVDEVGLDVVKVAVEGAENDEERIAAEELVEEKIVSILSDADGALGETEEVKDLIEQIENPEEEIEVLADVEAIAAATNTVSIAPEEDVLEDADSEDALPQTPSGTVDTTDLSAEEPTSKQTITSILEEVDKTSEKVTDTVAEIKALIEAGELAAALEKAKELRQVTAASEQATIDIKQAVKEVAEKQAAEAAETEAEDTATPSSEQRGDVVEEVTPQETEETTIEKNTE